MEKKLAVIAACLIAVVVQAAPVAPPEGDFTLAPSKGLAAPVLIKVENILAKPVLIRGAPVIPPLLTRVRSRG
jgi:hypothetical protein